MPVELVLGLSPRALTMRCINACLAGATRLLPGLLGYQIMHLAAVDPSLAEPQLEQTAAELLRLADRLAAPLGTSSAARAPSRSSPAAAERG
jgi:hypothetical protein